ncbi:DUF2158 domain-containing protein [Aeromonas veronii]|uniref:YodC family protein n=1 Tax=Aeromonas veronii TaxID=654 RepID=UPI0038D4F0D4|nr:DUF2158 domain-containing protein [Aeromonas veronii]
MNGTFKSGDVVRLKSGGPAMTVTSLKKDASTETYYCRWFSSESSSKSELEHFNAECLERVK